MVLQDFALLSSTPQFNCMSLIPYFICIHLILSFNVLREHTLT
uniref:Uncharacterized protein n=1 Tax=Anguilla anguilla TaxID=7936 RepID=A0A0E9WKE4_ANGAN